MDLGMPRLAILLILLFSALPALALPPPEFGARVQLEHIDYDGDRQSPRDGFFWRAIRLSMAGQNSPGWGYKVEYDVAYGHADAENLYIRYQDSRNEWSLGERKVPLGLARLTSAGRLTLAERPAPIESLTDSTRFGFWFARELERGLLQTMLYSRSINDSGNARPVGVAARLVFNPVRDGDRIVHLATAAAYENVDRRAAPSYSARPESRPDRGRFRLLNTGSIEDVANTFSGGLEAAFQVGALTTQAEYIRVQLDRRRAANPGFDGWYVESSYRLTGEPQTYDGSSFRDVIPRGAYGAWEVAARYSRLDLTGGGIRGGRQDAVTLALNWYATQRVRFYANLVDLRARDGEVEIDGVPVGRESARIVTLRTQIGF